MELPRSLTLVNYAVNGAGLGHVTRLTAINRWLRRYGAFAGVRTQHWFLTTSEADSWLFAEGFAAFKLPSKSIVETAGIPKVAYLALAKQWVWNTVALLRPDLFIADTFPNGSFDELAPVLDLCRSKALVLRPVKPEVAARPGFRAAAQLYDRIVVPGPLPEPAFSRARQVGPIMLTERFEALPREEARKRLGVTGDAFALLVTGGGGGDEGVARLFAEAEAAVAGDASVHLVFAAGPLYRGPVRRGPGITWLTEPHLATLMPGLDGAIAAGGYNTVHELAFFGVPAVLVSQEKVADDQSARVAVFCAAGAAIAGDGSGPALSDSPSSLALPSSRSLKEALSTLRLPDKHAAMAAAGRAMVPRNDARQAAALLLSLALPASVVRQAQEQLDEQLMSALGGVGLEPGEVVDLAVALQGRVSLDRASLELEAAATFASAARAHGVPAAEALRLAQALGRAQGPGFVDAHEWVDVGLALMEHPAVAGQWSSLSALVTASVAERPRSPQDLAAQVTRFLDGGAAAGKSLFTLLQERTTQARSMATPSLPAVDGGSRDAYGEEL